MHKIPGLLLFGLIIFTSQSTQSRAENLTTGPIPAPVPSVANPKPVAEPGLVTDIRALEVKVLGNAPESESIDDRLAAMEVKLFGQKSSSSLFERLSKIRAALNTPATLTTEDTAAKPTVPDVVTTPASAVDSSAVDVSIPGSARMGAKSPPVTSSSKVAELHAARVLFEDKDYKGARKLIEAFIARNPLIYNGHYLLGLIDLKEHNALPEYDQFAFNQILKALYIAPRSPDCYAVFLYVLNLETAERYLDPRFVAVSNYDNGNPRALLCVGVNCFLRDDDANAKDLFDFVLKYSPGGAASANYNLGAMAEKRGQLQAALTFYRAALNACNDRNALRASRMLSKGDVDTLSPNLIRRTMQRLAIKIKANDKTWTGVDQAKGTQLTDRCTINRLSTVKNEDIRDAGEYLPQ